MCEDEIAVSIVFGLVMVAVFWVTSLAVDKFDLFGRHHQNIKTCEDVKNA